jgi:hypothetical protein
LARDHADDLTVVGLGTQDTFADAEAFGSEFDMSATRVLWEEASTRGSCSIQPNKRHPVGRRQQVVDSWQGPVSPRRCLDALP